MKTTAKPKRPRGRPPLERTRSAFKQVRAFPEWVEWLDSIAEQMGMEASDIISDAVKLWARKHKVPPPPER